MILSLLISCTSCNNDDTSVIGVINEGNNPNYKLPDDAYKL